MPVMNLIGSIEAQLFLYFAVVSAGAGITSSG